MVILLILLYCPQYLTVDEAAQIAIDRVHHLEDRVMAIEQDITSHNHSMSDDTMQQIGMLTDKIQSLETQIEQHEHEVTEPIPDEPNFTFLVAGMFGALLLIAVTFCFYMAWKTSRRKG